MGVSQSSTYNQFAFESSLRLQSSWAHPKDPNNKASPPALDYPFSHLFFLPIFGLPHHINGFRSSFSQDSTSKAFDGAALITPQVQNVMKTLSNHDIMSKTSKSHYYAPIYKLDGDRIFLKKTTNAPCCEITSHLNHIDILNQNYPYLQHIPGKYHQSKYSTHSQPLKSIYNTDQLNINDQFNDKIISKSENDSSNKMTFQTLRFLGVREYRLFFRSFRISSTLPISTLHGICPYKDPRLRLQGADELDSFGYGSLPTLLSTSHNNNNSITDNTISNISLQQPYIPGPMLFKLTMTDGYEFDELLQWPYTHTNAVNHVGTVCLIDLSSQNSINTFYSFLWQTYHFMKSACPIKLNCTVLYIILLWGDSLDQHLCTTSHLLDLCSQFNFDPNNIHLIPLIPNEIFSFLKDPTQLKPPDLTPHLHVPPPTCIAPVSISPTSHKQRIEYSDKTYLIQTTIINGEQVPGMPLFDEANSTKLYNIIWENSIIKSYLKLEPAWRQYILDSFALLNDQVDKNVHDGMEHIDPIFYHHQYITTCTDDKTIKNQLLYPKSPFINPCDWPNRYWISRLLETWNYIDKNQARPFIIKVNLDQIPLSLLLGSHSDIDNYKYPFFNMDPYTQMIKTFLHQFLHQRNKYINQINEYVQCKQHNPIKYGKNGQYTVPFVNMISYTDLTQSDFTSYPPSPPYMWSNTSQTSHDQSTEEPPSGTNQNQYDNFYIPQGLIPFKNQIQFKDEPFESLYNYNLYNVNNDKNNETDKIANNSQNVPHHQKINTINANIPDEYRMNIFSNQLLESTNVNPDLFKLTNHKDENDANKNNNNNANNNNKRSYYGLPKCLNFDVFTQIKLTPLICNPNTSNGATLTTPHLPPQLHHIDLHPFPERLHNFEMNSSPILPHLRVGVTNIQKIYQNNEGAVNKMNMNPLRTPMSSYKVQRKKLERVLQLHSMYAHNIINRACLATLLWNFGDLDTASKYDNNPSRVYSLASTLEETHLIFAKCLQDEENVITSLQGGDGQPTEFGPPPYSRSICYQPQPYGTDMEWLSPLHSFVKFSYNIHTGECTKLNDSSNNDKTVSVDQNDPNNNTSHSNSFHDSTSPQQDDQIKIQITYSAHYSEHRNPILHTLSYPCRPDQMRSTLRPRLTASSDAKRADNSRLYAKLTTSELTPTPQTPISSLPKFTPPNPLSTLWMKPLQYLYGAHIVPFVYMNNFLLNTFDFDDNTSLKAHADNCLWDKKLQYAHPQIPSLISQKQTTDPELFDPDTVYQFNPNAKPTTFANYSILQQLTKAFQQTTQPKTLFDLYQSILSNQWSETWSPMIMHDIQRAIQGEQTSFSSYFTNSAMMFECPMHLIVLCMNPILTQDHPNPITESLDNSDTTSTNRNNQSHSNDHDNNKFECGINTNNNSCPSPSGFAIDKFECITLEQYNYFRTFIPKLYHDELFTILFPLTTLDQMDKLEKSWQVHFVTLEMLPKLYQKIQNDAIIYRLKLLNYLSSDGK